MPCRAYGGGYGPGTCLYVLSDLTEDQKTKIAELEVSHQKTMAELRVKQRSTYDFDEKIVIREEMLQNVQAHRNEVRNLLTENQKKQYDMLHSQYGVAGGRFNAGRGAGPWQGGYGRRGFRGGW